MKSIRWILLFGGAAIRISSGSASHRSSRTSDFTDAAENRERALSEKNGSSGTEASAEKNQSSIASITPYIIGGDQASPGAYPYFSSVAGGSAAVCGASLIAPDLLISAAHCSGAFDSGKAIVSAYLLGVEGDTGGDVGVQARTVNIVRRLVHPDYLGDELFDGTSDLMLLQIDPPVMDITPIKVNTDWSLPIDGASLQIMGFGVTEDGTVSFTLLEAEIFKVADNDCQNTYGISSDILLCAYDANPLQKTCQGDSGGPLVDNVSGKLMGVLSFGPPSCMDELPSGFTRLSAYMEWLTVEICGASAYPPVEFACDDGIETSTAEPTPVTTIYAPGDCTLFEISYAGCLQGQFAELQDREDCAACVDRYWSTKFLACADDADVICLIPQTCSCGACVGHAGNYLMCLGGCIDQYCVNPGTLAEMTPIPTALRPTTAPPSILPTQLPFLTTALPTPTQTTAAPTTALSTSLPPTQALTTAGPTTLPPSSPFPTIAPSITSTAPSWFPTVISPASPFPSTTSTAIPTTASTGIPSSTTMPSTAPSIPTTASTQPSAAPSISTAMPTLATPGPVSDSPSAAPSQSTSPSAAPDAATQQPTGLGTSPTVTPTGVPLTAAPTPGPSVSPTASPSGIPSLAPFTVSPSPSPTLLPTAQATATPTIDRVCSFETRSYQDCLVSNLQFPEMQACTECINGRLPPTPESCSAFDYVLCSDCGCSACTEPIRRYLECVTSCIGDCSEAVYDDGSPLTAFPTRTPISAVSKTMTAVPTIEVYGSPPISEAALSPVSTALATSLAPTTKCRDTERAYSYCMDNQLVLAEKLGCLNCVNGAWPTSTLTCSDFSNMLCVVPKTCGCGICADEIGNHLECMTGCTSSQGCPTTDEDTTVVSDTLPSPEGTPPGVYDDDYETPELVNPGPCTHHEEHIQECFADKLQPELAAQCESCVKKSLVNVILANAAACDTLNEAVCQLILVECSTCGPCDIPILNTSACVLAHSDLAPCEFNCDSTKAGKSKVAKPPWSVDDDTPAVVEADDATDQQTSSALGGLSRLDSLRSVRVLLLVPFLLG